MKEKIIKWLSTSATVPSSNFDAALGKHLVETGKWFLEGPDFARWQTEANSFLWLAGKGELISVAYASGPGR